MTTRATSAVEARERRLAVIAATAVSVVVGAVLVGVLFGELPELAWVLTVPVGMLGGGVTAIVSTAMLVASRRARSARAFVR